MIASPLPHGFPLLLRRHSCFVDLVISIPYLLLAIAVVAALGPSLAPTVFVLGVTRWPRYARVTFAQTLATREREFVEAAIMVTELART